MIRNLGAEETHRDSIQEASKSQFLNVCAGDVSQLEMPALPNLLRGSQVLVGRMEHIRQGLESGNGFSLGEQGDTRKEAAIVSESEQLLAA